MPVLTLLLRCSDNPGQIVGAFFGGDQVQNVELPTGVSEESFDVPESLEVAQLLGEIDGFARRVLDAAPRDGVSFGPPAQAPATATRLEHLVAFTGRDPAWRP